MDSFHVIKFINHQIQLYMAALARRIRVKDFERHQEREHALQRNLKFKPSKEYQLVKHYQWIVLKNQNELEYSAPRSFQKYLGFYADIHQIEYMLFQIDPDLKVFRRLKEKYIRFNNEYGDSPKKARPQLRQIIQDYRFSGYKMFRDIADTLDYHFESIINSFIVIERICADGTHKSRLSNGPIESLNRIVKDLVTAEASETLSIYGTDSYLPTEQMPRCCLSHFRLKDTKLRPASREGLIKMKLKRGNQIF